MIAGIGQATGICPAQTNRKLATNSGFYNALNTDKISFGSKKEKSGKSGVFSAIGSFLSALNPLSGQKTHTSQHSEPRISRAEKNAMKIEKAKQANQWMDENITLNVVRECRKNSGDNPELNQLTERMRDCERAYEQAIPAQKLKLLETFNLEEPSVKFVINLEDARSVARSVINLGKIMLSTNRDDEAAELFAEELPFLSDTLLYSYLEIGSPADKERSKEFISGLRDTVNDFSGLSGSDKIMETAKALERTMELFDSGKREGLIHNLYDELTHEKRFLEMGTVDPRCTDRF